MSYFARLLQGEPRRHSPGSVPRTCFSSCARIRCKISPIWVPPLVADHLGDRTWPPNTIRSTVSLTSNSSSRRTSALVKQPEDQAAGSAPASPAPAAPASTEPASTELLTDVVPRLMLARLVWMSHAACRAPRARAPRAGAPVMAGHASERSFVKWRGHVRPRSTRPGPIQPALSVE